MHLDIGFVDLGLVIVGVHFIKLGLPPVTVYTCDKEPFCVAKCLVMLEMLRKVDAESSSVLEVWTIILWSELTFREYLTAVRKVQKSHAKNCYILAVWLW